MEGSMQNWWEEKYKIEVLLHDKACLMTTITYLKEEIEHLNSKLEGMTKYVRMVNSRTENLKEILREWKTSKDMKGIGYTYGSFHSKNMFVEPIKKTEFIISSFMSQNLVKHRDQHHNVHSISSCVYHYCGLQGHIWPYCYRLYDRLSYMSLLKER